MSIQPRKQRKNRYEAPLHKRQKYISSSLSKDLKEEVGVKSLPLKIGDKIKVLRGDYKEQEGKVIEVNYTSYKAFIEGITFSKPDGNAVIVPIDPSNLMIIDADLKDEKRLKNIKEAS
ncbi:MAG: 50S ribosomal protein L24 [Methanobacteriaceae archaeon]|jgi:large subunit ribosomal protein L24|nr:50S ribosomal protein L24 [Methanobacteriaceae archaeon]